MFILERGDLEIGFSKQHGYRDMTDTSCDERHTCPYSNGHGSGNRINQNAECQQGRENATYEDPVQQEYRVFLSLWEIFVLLFVVHLWKFESG